MLEHIRSWSLRAKCRGNINDVLFFPEQRADVDKGKKACTGCPVMGQCRLYAVVHNVPGIWGGTSYAERKRLIGPEAREILQELFLEQNLLEGSLRLLVEQRVEQFYPTVHEESY